MSVTERSDVPAELDLPAGYGELLEDIKHEIKGARLRTAIAVNTEMVALYWRIGHLILTRQQNEGWGAEVVKRLSADLRVEYPQVKGFSKTNLNYMRAFAQGWPDFSPSLGENSVGPRQGLDRQAWRPSSQGVLRATGS